MDFIKDTEGFSILTSIATFDDTDTSFTATHLQTQICFSSHELVLQVLKQVLRSFGVTDAAHFFFKLKEGTTVPFSTNCC